MIDSVGGSAQVNNFLSTMNMKTINDKNLKIMERRAGKFVEEVAEHSMKKAAEGAFEEEMRLVYYKGKTETSLDIHSKMLNNSNECDITLL